MVDNDPDDQEQDEVLCDNGPNHDVPDHTAHLGKNEEKILLNSIVSINVNGLGDTRNRNIIMNRLDEIQPDLAILVDTRLRDDIATKKSLIRSHPYKFYICEYTDAEVASRGVIIMVKNIDSIQVLNTIKDPLGRFIIMELTYQQRPLLVVGVYGPPKDDPVHFWEALIDEVQLLNYENFLIMGDVNFVTNTSLDWLNHSTDVNNKPKTAKIFRGLINEGLISDAYRQRNPQSKTMSWRRWNNEDKVSTDQKSRIDNAFVSPQFLSLIHI